MSKIPDIVIIYEDRNLINYSPFDLYKTGSTIRLGINGFEDFYAMLLGSYGIEDIAFVDGDKALNGDIQELLKKEEGDEFFDSMLFIALGYIPSPEEIEDNYSCENENGRLMTYIEADNMDENTKKISDIIKSKYSNLTKPEGFMLSSFNDILNYNGIAIDLSAEYAIEYDELRRDFFNIQCVGDIYKLYIHKLALIYPDAVFDTSKGPVVIDDGAVIKSGSYIEGPCYIGKNVIIDGGRIYKDSSIFEDAIIMGRIEKSILYKEVEVLPYSTIRSSICGNFSKIGSFCDIDDKDCIGLLIGDYSEILEGSLISSSTEVSFGCKLNIKRHNYPHLIPPFIKNSEGVEFEEYSFMEFIKNLENRIRNKQRDISQEMINAIKNLFEQTNDIRVKFLNSYNK